MSLADELLADLEADEDAEDEASFEASGRKHQSGDLSENALLGTVPMEQGMYVRNVEFPMVHPRNSTNWDELRFIALCTGSYTKLNCF